MINVKVINHVKPLLSGLSISVILHGMKIDRKIPATMATQHPDHANVPYWKESILSSAIGGSGGGGMAFVSAQEEVEECRSAFQDMACQEFMWDWEGKYVDEAVVDKLFSNYYDFFKKVRLGRDVFLTFRVPNIWEEKGYRLARAFIGILTFEDLANDLGFGYPPVFEVILPMTDEAKKLIYLQKTFSQVAALKRKTFGEKESRLTYLRVIPLIEGVSELTESGRILRQYLKQHHREFGRSVDYLRPFVARSDPSLNDGLVPATVAAKLALSEYYRFQEETGIPVFPIIGVGGLPFRGGLSPDRLKLFLEEYRGVRTVTIQSAFRYDFPREQVKKSIEILNRSLREGKATLFSPEEIRQGIKLNAIFSRFYQDSVESLAGMINEFARFIPQRRERMLHFGLFGYARGLRGIRLPRAIGFTAALYSFGVPPELIGTGRGIAEARKKGLLDILEGFYLHFREDMIEAGSFLNKENLAFLAKRDSAWGEIMRDIEYIEEYLQEELGPRKPDHFLHRNLVSSTYLLWKEGRDCTGHILEAAKIRRGLG
ncbi:MAG TPA: phosphoenolpyruvate carboxylase [Nitrospiria bacterium]|nr:phosphoenolpyruvate carboxylase [Nitrospiria bacterium]